MKRILSALLASALAGTLFAGCSGGSAPSSASSESPSSAAQPASSPASESPSSPAAAPEEEVSLKWAVWDIPSTVYYQPLLDAYKEKAPNVSIEMVDLGSADYMNMLITQLSGDADLDVVLVKDMPGYVNLIKQNRLEPLKSYISSAGIDTSLYGGTTEQLEMNGELYELPFRSDFWVLYYNKDHFDAAGVEYPSNDMTLDQYDELARKLTSGEGAEKVYGAHYHTWRSAIQLFGILDGKNTIVDGTYGFLKPYYERILKEQEDGICPDFATLKTSNIHYSAAFFNNQCATMNMGSWFMATQIEKVKTGESLSKNWGIVKYPHPDGVPAGTTLGTVTGIAVNAATEKKDAALDFMKFVSGPEGAKIMADTGNFPAIMSDEVVNSIASIEGFPSDENSKEALKTVKLYLEMPLHEKSADIETILNEEHAAIMGGDISLDEGLGNMDKRVGELLAA